MSWLAVAVAGGAIVGGVVSSRGAQKAADTQAGASDNALALQREIFDLNRADLEPWRQAGGNALNALSGELGMIPGYKSQFTTSPGYDFALSEGMRGVNNQFAAGGMFNSGARAKGLLRFGEGLASQEYGNYIARLQSQAGLGQTAVGQGVQAGQNFGVNAGNALENAGAARASGYAGQANAWGNAFNNAAYLAGQYQRPPASGNSTQFPGY